MPALRRWPYAISKPADGRLPTALGLPAVHPVELLAAAYGFAPEKPLAGVLESAGVQLSDRKAA